MVELESVHSQSNGSESSDEYEDIESTQKLIEEYDSDDDDFFEEESLLERISALVDIVPPTTRQRFKNGVYTSINTTFGVFGTVGSGMWILATAALLVLLPVSLELERDAMAVQQDFQMQQDQ